MVTAVEGAVDGVGGDGGSANNTLKHEMLVQSRPVPPHPNSTLWGHINLSSGATTYRYGLRRASSMYIRIDIWMVWWRKTERREMMHLVLCFSITIAVSIAE